MSYCSLIDVKTFLIMCIDHAAWKPSMAAPGMLSVTLHEATNLSIREDLRELPNDREHDHARPQGFISCHRCNMPYAIVIYEKSEAYLECYAGTTQHPLWVGKGRWTTRSFDVSSAGELLIYLYIRVPGSEVGHSDVCLGFARARPFDASSEVGIREFMIEQGTGSIHASFEYKVTGNDYPGDDDFSSGTYLAEGLSGSVFQVKKKDTGRMYAEKQVGLTEGVAQLQESIQQHAPGMVHPFIAPVMLTFLSDFALHIFSPFASGGPLFHLVQTERCLSIDSCRFYAAEIVCALEYLHTIRKVFCWMKTRNVLLDATGHIVLCGFRQFVPHTDSRRRALHLPREELEPERDIGLGWVERSVIPEHYSFQGIPEYPAPELLLTDKSEWRPGDWWTLGVFIYEMLTGLPPFYDPDPEHVRENILNANVCYPETMPALARDLVSKLLDRSPEKRLGTLGGASEVKAHPFFDEIDWHQIALRMRTPPFKPKPRCWRLEQHGVHESIESPRVWAFSDGSKTIGPGHNFLDLYLNARSSVSEAHHVIVMEGDNWELLWEEGNFQFFNPTTNARQTVPPRQTCEAVPSNDVSVEGVGTPSLSQKLDALEAALLAGHLTAVVQLLNYEIDLNVRLFGRLQQTPLHWAVERGDLNLVQLFLEHGASVSTQPWEITIVKAVTKGFQSIVEALLPRTDRTSCTISLGVAVSERQVSIVELLLKRGVCCDFKDTDRPLPADPWDYSQYGRDESEPDNFRAPLIRAILLGQVDLVRLLLSHGANPNVWRHDNSFPCARAIEVAMKLEYSEIVHLLLDHGADIHLSYQAWDVPGHKCEPMPRPLYQKVTAGLRNIMAARKT